MALCLRRVRCSMACSVFFFSSRRRHRRLACDWSSDVSSSDLNPSPPGQEVLVPRTRTSWPGGKGLPPTFWRTACSAWRRKASSGRGAMLLTRGGWRSEEHTSELQSQSNLVCRLLLEKKKKKTDRTCDKGQRIHICRK